MYIVTGGAGFIGSNLIKGLNGQGINNILVVDDLSEGKKFTNLCDLEISDYCDKEDFLDQLKCSSFGEPYFGANIEGIFHQGACSSTTEWDGKMMLKNNYDYSKELFNFAVQNQSPFFYASSAAVYGGNQVFQEQPAFEAPLNVYGYSKLRFDQWLRPRMARSGIPIAGLRYFNVYGPREQHKGSMASVAYHFNNQVLSTGSCRLFEGTDGYGNGEQLRDFVSVKDIVSVNLWLLNHFTQQDIFNVGTGKAQSFNDVANTVLDYHQQKSQTTLANTDSQNIDNKDLNNTNGRGNIEYISFPEHLKGAYQSYTQANISKLRQAGFTETFQTVQQGVLEYCQKLNQK